MDISMDIVRDRLIMDINMDIVRDRLIMDISMDIVRDRLIMDISMDIAIEGFHHFTVINWGGDSYELGCLKLLAPAESLLHADVIFFSKNK
jgi:hypothetical protein